MEFRSTALHDFVNCAGFERLAPFVRWQNPDVLRQFRVRKRPALLISWHVATPGYSIVAGLYRLGIPALFLVYKAPPVELPQGFEVCPTSGPPENRAIALKRALNHLKGGGLVFIAMDGRIGDTTHETTFLGRRFPLRRGPGILARLTGAPVLPVLARWQPRARRITITAYEPLPPPICPPESGVLFEDALAAEAWRWFEHYLRATPEEVGIEIPRWLRNVPPSQSG
jgi:lauroyl/myristoyl acyltransferase